MCFFRKLVYWFFGNLLLESTGIGLIFQFELLQNLISDFF